MVFMVSMVLVSLFGFYNVRFSILDVFQNDPYPGRLCFKMILIRLCFKMILIRCFKMIRVPQTSLGISRNSQFSSREDGW